MRSENEIKNRISELKNDIFQDLLLGMNMPQYISDEIETLEWVLEDEDE